MNPVNPEDIGPDYCQNLVIGFFYEETRDGHTQQKCEVLHRESDCHGAIGVLVRLAWNETDQC